MLKGLMTALLLAAPAAASAQAAARADTVKLGKYDLEITMESGTLVGELTVKRENGAYLATITAGAMKPAVQSFKREGSSYVLTAGNTEHSVTYTFTFARDSVHGTFALGGGMTGTVAGLFKP